MDKMERKQFLIDILEKIDQNKTKPEVVGILSRLISEVGAMKYRLDDMPLVTGALNLLVSSIVLDFEEKEVTEYEHNTALKTIVDLSY